VMAIPDEQKNIAPATPMKLRITIKNLWTGDETLYEG
jgi:hypothetical protein